MDPEIITLSSGRQIPAFILWEVEGGIFNEKRVQQHLHRILSGGCVVRYRYVVPRTNENPLGIRDQVIVPRGLLGPTEARDFVRAINLS